MLHVSECFKCNFYKKQNERQVGDVQGSSVQWVSYSKWKLSGCSYLGASFLGGNWLGEGGGIVLGGNWPGDNFPGGNCPGGNYALPLKMNSSTRIFQGWRLEFWRYEIELRNRVTQNDVTLWVTQKFL